MAFALGFWAWCIIGIPILMVLGVERLRVAIPFLVLSYVALWMFAFASHDDTEDYEFDNRRRAADVRER